MKKIILTGDRPTGRLHLGHFVGSLQNRVQLQNSGEYEMNVMIADLQALTDNFKNPAKVKENINNLILDYLSVGIDPEKSNIFLQSGVRELMELAFYFLNLVSVPRLSRNPTVKEELKTKEFASAIPTGFFCYPISQAADILSLNADLVPVGEDQLPMIELTREIATSFNNIYGKFFKLPEALIPQEKFARRLPGIDGNAKMGKSLGNAIYLSDSEKDLHDKVFSMYTDPEHIHIEQPGKIEGNMVFAYLDVFANDNAKVKEMKLQYKNGGLGDVACKKYLFEVLNNFLKPIREKRAELEKKPEYLDEVLRKGTANVRKQVQKNMNKVRNLMQLYNINI